EQPDLAARRNPCLGVVDLRRGEARLRQQRADPDTGVARARAGKPGDPATRGGNAAEASVTDSVARHGRHRPARRAWRARANFWPRLARTRRLRRIDRGRTRARAAVRIPSMRSRRPPPAFIVRCCVNKTTDDGPWESLIAAAYVQLALSCA